MSLDPCDEDVSMSQWYLEFGFIFVLGLAVHNWYQYETAVSTKEVSLPGPTQKVEEAESAHRSVLSTFHFVQAHL